MMEPGRNIALKVPAFRWQETVAFYRDRVGLKVLKTFDNSVSFAFGPITLWVDRVAHQSQADVWLELFTDHPEDDLAELGTEARDDLEPLDGVEGHWVSDPAGTILLLRKP